MVRKNLCGLTLNEIFNLIDNPDFKPSHAISIANNIYKKKNTDISQISNIPKKLKTVLESIIAPGTFPPVSSVISTDNTIKYLFRTEEGKEFETVYIPDYKRNTVCVSTQSGCRMGCRYCATAKYGFHGNLSAGEIINQIISIPEAGSINHVVFMGMGEPMDNLENVLKACEIVTAEWGMALGSASVTVSSVGITPGIELFLRNSDCNLTVSLHSPFPEERMILIPVEKIYPISSIIEILSSYPLSKKRRLSVAYLMIKNMNDSDLHLQGLIELLKGSGIRVNLLPFHKIQGELNESSSAERMQYFKHNLIISGISASIRKSRGADILAACGLLATGMK
jgi:23S rRNA (adenine2503-C2)-methyltransferase